MIRKIIFYIILIFVTAIMSLAFLFFIKSDSAVKKARVWWPKVALLLLRIICNINYKILGMHNAPKGRAIIAAKHQSALETFAIALTFPHAIFILKKELVQIPLIGIYLKSFGMIYIDRSQGKKAIQHIKTQLENLNLNSLLVIFPEGTRTQPGIKTEKYHSGVSLVYETLKWPVLPVALNTGMFWPKSGPIIPGTATIKILEPIHIHNYERKTFLEKLNKSIENESLDLYKDTIVKIRGKL